MSRSLILSLIISVLILGTFALVSQNYRTTATQTALESPLVASSSMPEVTVAGTDDTTIHKAGTPDSPPPTILFHQPAQEQLRQRQPTIYLAFDQPMDQAAVDAALTVAPATPLTLSWVENTLYLVPTSPLAPGQSYTFTLSTAARNQQGTPLAEPYTWRYQAPHDLTSVGAQQGLPRHGPFELRFSTTVDPSSVIQALEIEPAISVTLAFDEDHTHLQIRPDAPLLSATTYHVTFRQPVQTVDGRPLALIEPLTFTTAAPVVATEPSSGSWVDPATPIRITFAPPLDHAATAASLAITPPVTGTVGWAENTLILTPTQGYLQPLTNYAISVTHHSRTNDGMLSAAAPTAWTFNTSDLTRWADFGYGLKLQTIDANGARTVHYQTLPTATPLPTPLTFALHTLDLPAFLALAQREDAFTQNPLLLTDPETAVARWSASVRPAVSQNFLTTHLPDSVQPGLYLLNLETGYRHDQLLILLTEYMAAVKQDAKGLTVWVTEMNDAVAAAFPVRVYGKSGELLAEGQTDAEGVWRVDLAATADPWLVVAQQEDQVAAVGLRYEWRTLPTNGWGWEPETPVTRYTTYLYTERPLYRPGQTVFFKAIIRHDDDGSLTLPESDTPVTVRVRDARDNIVRTYDLRTNALGTVHGEFALATGAMLGDYKVEAEVDGELTRHFFKVEEYRKPDYSVTVAATSQVISGSTVITVTGSSHYLNGRAVAHAPVTIKPYTLLTNGYLFGRNMMGTDWSDGAPTTESSTDATGRFTATLTLDPTAMPYAGMDTAGAWAIEATVNDGSNQSVSAVTQLNLLSALGAAERLTLIPDTGSTRPGELVFVTVGATAPPGKPAAQQRMRLYIETVPTVGGLFAPGVQRMELTTKADGTLRLPFLAETAGFYRLRLEQLDMKGYSTATPVESHLLAYDPAQPWTPQPDGFLAITTDRQRYTPGDSATLTIASSYGGSALITVERGVVRRTQTVQLTPPQTTLLLPITAEDAPNLFVTVNAWTPPGPLRDTNRWRTQPDRHLRTAHVEVAVTPVNKRLTVAVTPDRTSYAPRADATLQVQVTDETGAPVAAELSLALVDEAIFQLSEPLATPIFDAFYHPRAHTVKTYDALAPTRVIGGFGGGGGGGGFLPANPRWHFPDTAAWLPVMQTDEKGAATVKLTLPDTLTSWRVVVKAITAATQVGEATAHVVTTQPLSIQPLLPPGLTAGDQAVISALVHNDTALTRTLTVTLGISTTQTTTPALVLVDAPTQTISLAPNATQVVGWAVQAEAAGTVALVLAAASKDFSDAVQAPLAIRPLAIPNVAVQVGHFTGTLTTTITLPVALAELSTVQIELNRSLAGSMLEGLQYLTGYPYGCVEQTMSRALPNAVVGRAFAQLGVGDPDLNDQLPGLINAGLQQLYAFQHDDGGWGWWFDDQSDAYQTAWVLFGLAVTADAGYEVDGGVIARGVNYLTERMATLDVRTQAFALYAITLGTPDVNRKTMQTLAEQSDQLDTFSQAALALALYGVGEAAQAAALVDQLAAAATVADGLVYWADGDADGTYQQKTMASAIRSTALALRALIRIRPNHELEPGIVEWLMSKRQVSGWGTTNETAFTLLALTDHLRNATSAAAEAAYTIWLNGEEVGQGVLQPTAPLGTVKLDATQLNPGNTELRLAGSDDRRLYYRITTRAYEMEATKQRAGTLAVYREYIDVQTRQPLTQIAAGALVEVQLTVQSAQPASYLLVEDALPGGLEAINERLNVANRGLPIYDESQMAGNDYGYNYKEVRRDRVSFFVTEMPPGSWRVSYLARAVTTGAFVALPTEAYAMYDERIWGRSASSPFVVAEE